MPYYELHHDSGLNFTLNRLAQAVSPEEIKDVASRIHSLESWITQLSSAGEHAEQKDRLVEAARYFQSAEFYMKEGTSGKLEMYRRSINLMDRALPAMMQARDSVPYEGGQLAVVRLPALVEERDIVLIHSGFDGLVEEIYPLLEDFRSEGYSVIAFEGPGQGSALRNFNLRMPFDWERPVGVILDHYAIDSCTLIGMSLGGYLAPRAAAFEHRVKRVVAWGAMFDFYDVYRKRMSTARFKMLSILLDLNFKGLVNRAIASARIQDDILDWAVSHGMHVSGTATPADYLKWVKSLNLRNCAHLIQQDALLIMGAEDHLVSTDQLYTQAQSMVCARSVTSVMLTATDQAEQHCQVGNTAVAVRLILEWLQSLEQRESSRKGKTNESESD